MRAAIYCRLSKEDEHKTGESESIQNQKSMLIEYAVQKGFDIYQIYSDEDYSGIDRDRPAFNAMLEAARQHKFDVVLAKTQSRFTRDMELVEKYLHGKFVEWGIRFIAVVDHVDTDDRANKKSRQINGLVNEWYLEDLSNNVRSVLDHKRREGQYIASFALYGYRKDPDARGSRWPAAGSGRTRSRKYSTAKGSPVLLPTNSSTVFPTRPLCKVPNRPSGGRRRSTRCCATVPTWETWSRAGTKRSVINPNGPSGCLAPSGSWCRGPMSRSLTVRPLRRSSRCCRAAVGAAQAARSTHWPVWWSVGAAGRSWSRQWERSNRRRAAAVSPLPHPPACARTLFE